MHSKLFYFTVGLDISQLHRTIPHYIDRLAYHCKNFEMQELIEKFVENGLTHEQAQLTLQTLTEWLEKHYPVAGTLTASWIKNNSSES